MKTKTILAVPILILLLIAAVVSAPAQSLTPQQTLDQARIAEEKREAQSDNVNPEASCPKVVVTTPPAGFTRSPESTSFLAEEKLKHCVADLQKTPGDTALRGRIIQLAQIVKPAPAIPEEARRHYVMAKTLFEGARKAADFADSIAEFKSALLLAPWWPEANRDLGLASEAAGQFDEAIAYVKLYMATNPGDERMRAAQDEIYKIEAKEKLAAKARIEEAVAARPRSEDTYEAWLRALGGARFISGPSVDPDGRPLRSVYYISGRQVFQGWIEGVQRADDFRTAPIRGVEFNDNTWSRSIQNKEFTIPRARFEKDQRPCVATISDDGQLLSTLCPGSGVVTYTRVK